MSKKKAVTEEIREDIVDVESEVEIAVKSALKPEAADSASADTSKSAPEEKKASDAPEKPAEVADSSSRAISKADKKRQRAEQKAALRKLDELKKQIKKGVLPYEAPKVREPEADHYGEKLPYPGGFPVYCSKYVIIADGSNKLAMRFFNASDILVTGMRFTVTQKDKEGNVIAVKKLERSGLFAERGTEFAVADAEVEKGCVAVEIHMNVIASEQYEYVIDGFGDVTLRFGTTDPTADLYFKNKRSCTISRRRRGYAAIAVAAVITVAAVAVTVAVKMGIVDKAIRHAEDSAAITYQINGGDLYVEA